MNSTGLWSLGWQKKLTTNGKNFSSDNFLYSTDSSKLEGRACPTNATLPNVFLSDTNKFATGRCLYYDKGSNSQQLSLDISSWNLSNTGNGTQPAWYEGNNTRCGNRGMRLPTAFETRIDPDTDGKGWNGYPLTQDGIPLLAKQDGVPALPANSFGAWNRTNGEATQTATASTSQVTAFIVVKPTNVSAGGGGADDTTDFYYVRCVLP